MQAMAIFIEWPWLAFVAAAAFAVLAKISHCRTARFAAGSWLVYGIYEFGMELRILCSGECNIRIDLFLIYPFLILASVLAVALSVWQLLQREVST